MVEAVRRCADCPDTKSQAVNICSGSTISVKELARMVLDIVGRSDLEPERLPPRQGDVEHAWGDNALAKKLLGWEPKVPIEKGLVQCVEWCKDLRDPAV